MSDFIQLQPFDEHNAELGKQVHPPNWQNPEGKGPYQLIVVGAGTAGLVTAAGAAGLGARVALIERELMGGDCLNVGCVPSKGLIRAARAAAQVKGSDKFGVRIDGEVTLDFATAMQRMRRLRAKISPADSAERFTELGVDVYFGQARFKSGHEIDVISKGGHLQTLSFRKAVIATGTRAAVPSIPGLADIPYLTNETVFSLTELPPRIGVIGGGPIGVELAQAFARFGSQVTLFESADHILGREDADAAKIVDRQLRADGVDVFAANHIDGLRSTTDGGVRVTGTSQNAPYDVCVDKVLVATGRTPNTTGLNLKAAGVEYDSDGVRVDDQLCTSQPRIFAAGDVASKYKFTHAADFMARIVIQNALFRLGPFGSRRASRLLIPWATYTSPEVAHVGMYEHEAQQQGLAIDTYVQQLTENDRAILDATEDGFIKVHVKRGTDKIVGATIVAENAGDMISELTLAIQNGIGLGKVGATIHPYPTQADAIRRLGDQYNKTRLTPLTTRLLRMLMRYNVGPS